jgi:murein L,D-transpeptidase YafK
VLRWALFLAMAVIAAAGLYAHMPAGNVLPPDAIADRVIVDKTARTLTLLSWGRVLKSYPISLGRDPSGPKTRAGDSRTPEGAYLIDYRNPHSRFHLALHISYPNRADTERAAAAGVPPGGDIMVHGLPNGLAWLGRLHRLLDWTDGCIAVTDREIEEIYRVVPDGTPIEIRS